MHYSALTPSTLALWKKCGFLNKFYLAGGTSLALQLGHRKSIDLDFFTEKSLSKTLISQLEKKTHSTATILIHTKTELTVFISGVKLTFLQYPFALLFPLVKTDVIPLASVRDITSMKAYALGRRRSLKDYVDLYTVFLQNDLRIEEVILDAQTKFKDSFNDRSFLRQLLAPEDLEDEKIDWLIPAVSIKKMQSFFIDEIKKIKVL